MKTFTDKYGIVSVKKEISQHDKELIQKIVKSLKKKIKEKTT